MAVTSEDIRRQIESMTKTVSTIMGTVKEVDSTKRTCTIDDDGLEMPGIMLQAVTGSDKGVVIIPKVGTIAIAIKVEDNDGWIVIGCKEIESIRFDVGQTSVDIKDGEITFNGGSVGLTQTDKLQQKLNALEQRCNDIVTALQGITITLAPTGTVPLAPYFLHLTSLTQTAMSDIEDTKIKH